MKWQIAPGKIFLTISISPSEAVSKWRMPAAQRFSIATGWGLALTAYSTSPGNPVRKVRAASANFPGMNQIKRLARLQALNLLERAGEARHGIDAGRGVHGGFLGQALPQRKENGASA